MYLGVTLLNLDFDLIPSKSSLGPDLHFINDDVHYWIEAISPNEGEGPDVVPTLAQHHGYNPVPLEKVILRFTHSLKKKKDKFEKYLDKGIVGKEDVLIIGINGGSIGLIILDSPLPSIIKSVYPVGDYQMIIDKQTMEIVNSGYKTRYKIEKKTGASVSTTSFLDEEYSFISGVLYSDACMLNTPEVNGEDIIYIHNFLAKHQAERNWLNTGIEFFKKDNELIQLDNKRKPNPPLHLTAWEGRRTEDRSPETHARRPLSSSVRQINQ